LNFSLRTPYLITYCRFIEHCYSGPGSRKTLRKAEFEEMEKRLYEWFCTQRARHVPVSYEILATRAKIFHTQIYGTTNFEASRGWIANFRSRYGLRSIKICGEKLSNNQDAVDPFIIKLKEKIRELKLSPVQIYNADESALYWKMLPDKTLVLSQEKNAPGRKTIKERVTFLLCANADGSNKLKPLVIGKAQNPRAFKNAQIPVDYKASKNAWMTSSLFKDWFHNCFVKNVQRFQRSKNLLQKALLLVDNASSHGSAEELVSNDANVMTMFLPPNCTALIQPMDQNIIRLTKLFYRKSLLIRILTNEDDIASGLKKITLKEATYLLYNAWEKVSPNIISKCWHKILHKEILENPDSDYEAEDLIPLSTLRQNLCSISQELNDVGELLNSTVGNDIVITDEERDGWLFEDENLLPLDESLNTEPNEDVPETEVLKTVTNIVTVRIGSIN
jgi:hypothetical protein